MHDPAMAGKLTNLLKPRTWRTARAFLKAMGAYQKRDYEVALAEFDKSLERDALRTDVNMAFKVTLLTLNGSPVEERIDLYRRIVAGEFAHGIRGSEYARAYADYFLGYLSGRQDIVSLWSRAHALKPTKGFAARYLPLPESPILSRSG
jgi:hypothetical protein